MDVAAGLFRVRKYWCDRNFAQMKLLMVVVAMGAPREESYRFVGGLHKFIKVVLKLKFMKGN